MILQIRKQFVEFNSTLSLIFASRHKRKGFSNLTIDESICCHGRLTDKGKFAYRTYILEWIEQSLTSFCWTRSFKEEDEQRLVMKTHKISQVSAFFMVKFSNILVKSIIVINLFQRIIGLNPASFWLFRPFHS